MARLSLRKADVRNVSWAAIGAIATIVGVVLAAAQLLAARPSPALLAWLVVILVLATLLFIVLALLRRRQPVVVFMNIRNAAEQEEYYERFIECLSNARSVIYYSGRGFSGLTKESESYCLRTADAVRKAVDAGTEYFRIQTGRRVSATWADVYAELVEEYREGGSPRRGKVKVYEDTDDPTFVNISSPTQPTNVPVWCRHSSRPSASRVTDRTTRRGRPVPVPQSADRAGAATDLRRASQRPARALA